MSKQDLCPFCHEPHKQINDHYDPIRMVILKNYKNNVIAVFVNDPLNKSNDILSNQDNLIAVSQKLNYCPVCGRKLA